MSVVKLSKPITVGEETVAELELREPTGQDLSDIGYPFLTVQGDSGAALELRPKVLDRYLSRLSALPPSTFKDLSIPDRQAIHMEIMGFFGGSEE